MLSSERFRRCVLRRIRERTGVQGLAHRPRGQREGCPERGQCERVQWR